MSNKEREAAEGVTEGDPEDMPENVKDEVEQRRQVPGSEPKPDFAEPAINPPSIPTGGHDFAESAVNPPLTNATPEDTDFAQRAVNP